MFTFPDSYPTIPSDVKRGDFLCVMPKYGVVHRYQVNQQVCIPALNCQGSIPTWLVNTTLYNNRTPEHVRGRTAKPYYPTSVSAPKIPIYRMNVEELATWVKYFSNSKGWIEADLYAESFVQKGIDGKKIVRLSNNDLKRDLEIAKLGHRLEILTMVKELHSSPKARCAAQMERYHNTISSYSDSENSVISLDSAPYSAPEPDSWSGREAPRNFLRQDLGKNRTY